jgi:small subunit ribosomal protein S6
MQQYEIMLLTRADLDDAARDAVVDRARNAVAQNGGSWKNIDDWGRRKLAYPINHVGDAHYSLLQFDATGEALSEAVRQLRIADGVMRVMATVAPPPLPDGAELPEVSDEEYDAGPAQRSSRPRRGGGRPRR